MARIVTYVAALCILTACHKSSMPIAPYYPPQKLDTIGAISMSVSLLTSYTVSATGSWYCNGVTSASFSTGPVVADSLPDSTILAQYCTAAHGPFGIRYLTMDQPMLGSVLRRSDSSLVCLLNRALLGKEIFQVYYRDTSQYIYRRFIASPRQVIVIVNLATGGRTVSMQTKNIMDMINGYLKTPSLSQTPYAINMYNR